MSKLTKAQEKAINTAFLIKGEAYYCSLAQPNNKGQFASHCYEVGISSPSFMFSKKTSDDIKDVINEFIETDFIKTTETGIDETGKPITFCKIKNSQYPIPTYTMENERIETPRISNGTELTVKCKFNYSEKYNSFYITVIAVKLNEEYKEFKPFQDIDDFE